MPQDDNCAGQYYVSGYTRSDGVEVSGYTRSCGAAHNGNNNIYHLYAEKNNFSDNSQKSKIEILREKIAAEENKNLIKQLKRADILYPDMPDNPAVQKLKEAGEKELAAIEQERIMSHAKNIGLTALEIGSAFVPIVGEAKAAAVIAKLLAPKIGRAMAKQVAEGCVRGAASGGLTGSVQGLKDGLENDENLAASILKDGTIGAVSGAAGGAAIGLGTGKFIQSQKIKQLDELVDKRKDWGIAYQKFSGKPEMAIEHLLKEQKGFVPKAINKKGVGDIDFVWGDENSGIKHIIKRRNEDGYDGEKFVKQIPDIIKTGKVIEKEGHINRKYIINDDFEVAIRLDWDNKERKWLVSSYLKNKK